MLSNFCFILEYLKLNKRLRRFERKKDFDTSTLDNVQSKPHCNCTSFISLSFPSTRNNQTSFYNRLMSASLPQQQYEITTTRAPTHEKQQDRSCYYNGGCVTTALREEAKMCVMAHRCVFTHTTLHACCLGYDATTIRGHPGVGKEPEEIFLRKIPSVLLW